MQHNVYLCVVYKIYIFNGSIGLTGGLFNHAQ